MVTIELSAENGLRVRSLAMAEERTPVPRARLGPPIGRIAAREISQLNTALAFVMGLAD